MTTENTPAVRPIAGFTPDPKFIWQSSSKGYVKLEDMTTAHVFFALRMIWNHSVPEEARIHPYTNYEWVEVPDQFPTAAKEFYHELIRRYQTPPYVLQPYFIRCLQHMETYMLKHLSDRLETDRPTP